MDIKIECLPEPELLFGRAVRGLEPRRILSVAGPLDGGRRQELQLALVGLPGDIQAAKGWINRLNTYIPATEGNSLRFRAWPGAPQAVGARLVVQEKFMRPIDESRVAMAMQRLRSGNGFDELLELFDGRIHGLFGDSGPDCIVVCLPDDIADLRIHNPGLTEQERRALDQLRKEEEEGQLLLFQPSPEELRIAEDLRTQAEDLLFRTFYRALKSRSQTHTNPIPLQFLRRETVDRPDERGQGIATRAWNFVVSVYYKSGGLPWQPGLLPANICFVGISFNHLKRRSGSLVYASLAQAFSSEVEPFALKGATVPHGQRRNRQPYLADSEAAALMEQVIDRYELRAGTLPDRVVIHKTTRYEPEETAGFRGAAHGRVPVVDLVWIRSTPFRLVRRGFQEPWRGTLCRAGEEHYLFTSGFVPWWNEYPGPHIPSPLEIGSAGDTDIRARAQEILALSKVNWNNTEGISRYPVTLSFAKRVGQLMTELPEHYEPNPSYRYYM